MSRRKERRAGRPHRRHGAVCPRGRRGDRSAPRRARAVGRLAGVSRQRHRPDAPPRRLTGDLAFDRLGDPTRGRFTVWRVSRDAPPEPEREVAGLVYDRTIEVAAESR